MAEWPRRAWTGEKQHPPSKTCKVVLKYGCAKQRLGKVLPSWKRMHRVVNPWLRITQKPP